MRIVKLAILAAVAAWCGVSAASASPSVTVDGVVIDGTISPINSAVDDYFGIPYATAPRWAPPKAHAALASPFDASHFSTVAVCPQSAPVVISGATLPQSEDCLSLTVHVPASATPSAKLPVMVFIHGGEFQVGTGLEYFADNMIAANGIVVVTVNYRLGALGWLAQQVLEAAKADAFQNVGDAGNYGLMDQQFALAWVKKHIAAFGGDPRKVTIAGESAGGLSVLANMTSTATAIGLFRAGIVESGAYALRSLPSKAAYETNYGMSFVNGVLAATGKVDGIKCSSLTSASPPAEVVKCLDGATVDTLLAVQQNVFGGFGVSPNSATLIVPNALQKAFTTGDFIHVPVLAGINQNEGRYFEPSLIPFGAGFSTVVAAGGPANYDLTHANFLCGGAACTYTQEINLTLTVLGVPSSVNTALFDKTLAKTDYPLANFPDPYLSGSTPSSDMGLSQIGTDYNFACNAFDADTEMAAFTPVYAYEFADPLAPPTMASPAPTVAPNDQYGFPTASEHGAELQFLFAFPSTNSLSTEEQALETTMQAYWADFVKSDNPNKGSAVPAWPAFGTSNKVQELAPAPASIAPLKTFAKAHFCSVWEPLLSGE